MEFRAYDIIDGCLSLRVQQNRVLSAASRFRPGLERVAGRAMLQHARREMLELPGNRPCW